HLAGRMAAEIRELVPDRSHYVVVVGANRQAPPPDTTVIELEPGNWWTLYRQLRKRLRTKRIALAPVLFDGRPHPLRKAALCLVPRKILAYNAQLERHHLRPSTAVASTLFLAGVPVDRIFLRPRWLQRNKTDVSIYPEDYRVLEGRALSADRP